MGGMDAVAFAFAVAAVAVGLALTVYVVWSDGEPADVDKDVALHAPTLVIMLRGRGDTVHWRFESLADETITVDVFTQRAGGGDIAPAAWQHDLMSEALRLAPGSTANLPADPHTTRYEAVVGWYLGDTPDRRRDSLFIDVERH